MDRFHVDKAAGVMGVQFRLLVPSQIIMSGYHVWLAGLFGGTMFRHYIGYIGQIHVF